MRNRTLFLSFRRSLLGFLDFLCVAVAHALRCVYRVRVRACVVRSYLQLHRHRRRFQSVGQRPAGEPRHLFVRLSIS